MYEFGDVINGTMRYSEIGRLTQAVWEGLPRHYPHVKMDVWILMPNHLHAILILAHALVHVPRVGAGLKPAPTSKNAPRHGLPEIVRAFKTFSARRINAFRDTVGRPFWQRNYFEHVIRNDVDLNRIRQYIVDNPAEWVEDPENPAVRARRS